MYIITQNIQRLKVRISHFKKCDVSLLHI